ncbi:MAG: hypothetical protein ACYCPF_06760 [Streptosporangiaceae bacterium]
MILTPMLAGEGQQLNRADMRCDRELAGDVGWLDHHLKAHRAEGNDLATYWGDSGPVTSA